MDRGNYSIGSQYDINMLLNEDIFPGFAGDRRGKRDQTALLHLQKADGVSRLKELGAVEPLRIYHY